MRTLGIDLGARRVGLALSDAEGRLATPLDVLEVRGEDQAIEPVLRVIQEEGVERVVLGLPLNMDGTRGPAAKRVVEWGRKLSERCGLAVIYVDERLSSFDAEQQLLDRRRGGEKLTRQDRKRRLDAIAAAGFLQAYLDGRLPGLDP